MKRVGILRGGMGDGYDTSIREGGEVISYLRENLADKYKSVDILVDRDGLWHINGLPILVADLPSKVDVVWNTAHASFKNIIDSLSIPSVGVDGFSSALGQSREMLREHMNKAGIKMSRHLILPQYQKDFDGESIEKYAIKKAKEVHAKFGAPWIVRSLNDDKDMGIHVAKTFPELIDAIIDGAEHGGSLVVEELITGKAGEVHSVPGFRGENIYVFPAVARDNLSPAEKSKLKSLIEQLHQHLGVKNYLKTDFVSHANKGIYLTHVAFTPNLNKESEFTKAVHAVGAQMHHVVEHMLENIL